MGTVTIGGMTLGTAGNLTGAAVLEMEDSTSASVYYTAATLRTRMFAGGTGFTAADPLVCGTLNASGTSTLAAVTATGVASLTNGLAKIGSSVTAHSWDTTFSSVMQLASGAAVLANGDSDLRLAQGVYYNGGWKYSVGGTQPASRLELTGGTVAFLVAPGGALDAAASFTTAGTITSGGIFAWGTTTTTGASGGHMVAKNNFGLLSANAAGTNTFGLIYGTSSDGVYIDSSAKGTTFGGSVTAAGISSTGNTSGTNLIATAAAGSPGASNIALGNTIAASATAGSNGAPPAQVAGYWIVNFFGTQVKIPYYNN